jgi:hypothetical protein
VYVLCDFLDKMVSVCQNVCTYARLQLFEGQAVMSLSKVIDQASYGTRSAEDLIYYTTLYHSSAFALGELS